MAERLLLYRAPDSLDAALVAQRLDAEGVSVLRAGVGSSVVWGLLPVERMVELWIDPEEAPRAVGILREFEAERSGGGGSWSCATCGETTPESSELCWSCVAGRS